MKTKRCILNFADGTYTKGQERLVKSIRHTGFDGDLLTYNTPQPHWRSHETCPWGFKPFMFTEAKEKGYDQALWIDAAGIVIQPLEAIFRHANKHGVYVFSRYTASVGEWSSDYALDQLNITRAQAVHIPEISGFCIAIDFRHPKGAEFLKRWHDAAQNTDLFLGLPHPHTISDSMTNANGLVSHDSRVQGHRHDQTLASIFAHQLHIPISTKHIFDVIAESSNNTPYQTNIPFGTLILQNRDIKKDVHVTDITVFETPLLTKIVKGIKRYIGGYINKYRFKKRARHWGVQSPQKNVG